MEKAARTVDQGEPRHTMGNSERQCGFRQLSSMEDFLGPNVRIEIQVHFAEHLWRETSQCSNISLLVSSIQIALVAMLPLSIVGTWGTLTHA